ncbi:polysaccharide deacetylase family protein [Muricomes sp. OA1]|uniref:Peptidoglycan-N-acetylglucosamine deacetylase n=2 Tax=Lachnospirales TaxID=3085636 RepID=A0A3E2WHG8_9FIRM|nr:MULTISPECIES: polysaccharide deacetylase family protein [Clostridia]MCH1974323.1 polysaccharide deacetylase family protein [Muricomes sp. OA1]MEE0202303.1 polysaccharide deacetylase family protein [Muricomes sp.]MRM90439.1 peptidoglycan-N-acetylglucosamine deacetylase [Faecalicatena contorta]RGC26269.1 peptidoglycan-N-acetylglucosamine deacetylase [Hungatella hathewayi]
MCCLRLKRMMQGAGFVYVLLLLGAVCPSLFTIGKQAEGEAPGTAYANASAYVADSIMEKPKIAITFDDGPSAVYTPRLLDGLKERGVKATFFLIGQNIEKEGGSEIVKRMYEEGHLIGNHTYHHVEITKVSNDEAYQELMLTNEAIENITGEEVQFMRPPFGLWQKELEKKIHVLPVMWSIDPLDWATENVDEIVNKVVTEAQENDIILLHDCYDSSVKAALRIIDLLQAEGYEFVTVDELMLD